MHRLLLAVETSAVKCPLKWIRGFPKYAEKNSQPAAFRNFPLNLKNFAIKKILVFLLISFRRGPDVSDI